MAAPKFNHNLKLKDEKNNAEAEVNNSRLKVDIENYKNKIKEKLKDQNELKKAILIIEKMINSKNK